ncbi:alpha-L-fucosidase [Ilyomonas limi]|uniref:alpha-L-fucosidase n=1 Tax=Ilyomonas limi TaxID=2575867 RepID=A0A4U3KSW1_9BACT|nr:alpha-L-fucosidase [Ilyomonas limi]TKK65410.1 alpha-L-fucosidase [Ilyomonas limi]
MNRRKLLKTAAALVPAIWLRNAYLHAASGNTNRFMADGPFKPNWTSLQQYQTPGWYKNAKFGIWAHWGPQCQPEYGDWYARGMYQEGSDQYNYHLKTYGHPSRFGFKDVIHEWKAESWKPEELLRLYKEAGARYFVALANHHDNFDNYNSTYQPWNAVRMGPKKDLIGGWAKAARNHGLHFGVSVHAAHAWSWYEVAQRSDKEGTLKGVPYDGKLTREQGAGKWWAGYDPQDLYAQNHPLSEHSLDDGAIHRQWNWGNGVTPPSKEYCEKFYNRTVELIDKYEPDLLYFDDTALPLWPINDAGLRIAAHMYNSSIKKHGSLQAVINGKILDEQQRKCMVWDIERGQSNIIEPETWQTDTCIGSWHYDKRVYENHRYKTAETVIHTLVDVVSKNGNLLLSIPVKGDGTIDSDEKEVVKGITAWMKVNSNSIYDTHPYAILGEGPAMQETAALTAQGFNEGKGKPFTAEDIRFAQKERLLYATTLGVPRKEVLIKTLAGKTATRVALMGYNDKLNWKNTSDGLLVTVPDKMPTGIGSVFEIEGIV